MGQIDDVAARDDLGRQRLPVVMTRSLWLVGGVILLAGLLFGYDQGNISGALLGIEQTFSVSTTVLEIITSWVTLGALVGALVAGQLADRFGRRPVVIMSGLLFVVGALIEAFAPTTQVLIVGRLTVGAAVGITSVAAPLYAAEMAPMRLRGRFVSTYQLGITSGIFIAYFINQLLTDGDRWRLMLGLSAVVGVLLVVAIIPLPDSPRWYLKVGRRADAEASLQQVTAGDQAAAMAELEEGADDDEEQAGWREVFSARWRTPLMIGIGLAVFQQITGINAIIYYANRIFAAAGFDTPADQAAATTWAIGAVNVLATLIAVFYVDRLGRRKLLLTGLVGMGLSLTVVGFAFQSLDNASASEAASSSGPSTAGMVTLVALVVYIASFAFSMGPVVWTVINEIYPRRIRGRGVSLATAFNWFSAWLVSQFFLTLTENLGEPATFWLFAFFCLVAFGWIWRKVPETKGLTLEQIELMWTTRFNRSAR